jgi:C-terminal processing protease CtpA/Prc
MRRTPVVLFLAAAALLAGCSKEEDPCTLESQKAAVLDLVGDWYLYPELLPAGVNPADYETPAALLDALTANALAAGKDRGWSYVTTTSAQQSFFVEGTSVGFGIGLLIRDTTRLFVSQVYAGSAAADAGFLRGDEIVRIGDTPDALVPVADLIAAGTLLEALGPSAADVARTLEVVPRGDTTAAPRTMTKRTYDLQPVADWHVIDRAPNAPAGYVALRAFISPADADLRAAFAAFKAAGVTDVVVDLRYNGGGLLSTAALVADLLGGGLDGVPMFSLENNARHAGSNAGYGFFPEAASLTLPRVAFVVTGASASASELVPNVLEPHLQVALVGHQTYGKPVGQRGFPLSQCDLVVYLVSFRLLNSEGDGDYFGGLPASGFSGCGIPAEDDLLHDTWESVETSTAAALDWLATGSCPPPPAGPLSVSAPDVYPEPVRPTEAQRHVRGLF